MNKKSDKQLMNYIKMRSERAFEELMRRYHAKSRALAKRIGTKQLGDADIEEAIQDAWIQVWKYSHTYRGDAAVSSWIYRVCSNAVLMVMRKRKCFNHSVLSNAAEIEPFASCIAAETPLPDEQAATNQSIDQIRRLISLLDTIKDNISRQIVIYKALGYTPTETRDQLERKNVKISIPALKSRLYRAKEILQGLGIASIL